MPSVTKGPTIPEGSVAERRDPNRATVYVGPIRDQIQRAKEYFQGRLFLAAKPAAQLLFPDAEQGGESGHVADDLKRLAETRSPLVHADA
jgi:hypothetical protein